MRICVQVTSMLLVLVVNTWSGPEATGYEFGRDRVVFTPAATLPVPGKEPAFRGRLTGAGVTGFDPAGIPFRPGVKCYHVSPGGVVLDFEGRQFHATHETIGPYMIATKNAAKIMGLLELLHDNLPGTMIDMAGLSNVVRRVKTKTDALPLQVASEQIDAASVAKHVRQKGPDWLAHFLRLEGASVIEYKYVILANNQIGRLRRTVVRGPDNPHTSGAFLSPWELSPQKQQQLKDFKRSREFLISQTVAKRREKTEAEK